MISNDKNTIKVDSMGGFMTDGNGNDRVNALHCGLDFFYCSPCDFGGFKSMCVTVNFND